MAHGYNGKVLHVNLTTGQMDVEEPDEAFYRKYMGGSAMALHYLLKDMPAGVDPLGPDNVLVLALSVLTGTAISGQSRMTAAAKSPLTGAIGDSQGGGFFPAELKFAGFDAIVIKGKSEKPVYLWIKDGEYELRDASHLWGKITGEAESAIKEELGDDKVEVLQVGPAGENLVRFAGIFSMSNRANGRTGMGAVMGSKNLKAVAVRGKNRPSPADKDGLLKLAKWGAANLDDSGIAGLAKYGTAETTGANQAIGTLPTYNYNSGVFDKWEAIDGTTMYDTVLRGAADGNQDRLGRDTCYACTVRCKRVVEITEGDYKVDPRYGGPEYETTSTFGNYCAIDDLAAVSKANELCNKYGMDTISCGATISWAFEAFSEGKLTTEDTDGLDLSWGNAESMVKLVEKIALRDGFGDVLAEGSERAAKKFGRGTEEYLITFKGQEAPAHMPRVKRSLSVIYATLPFGADHQSSEHDPAFEDDFDGYKDRMAVLGFDKGEQPQSLTPEKMRFVAASQYMYSAMDSLNLCQFVYGPAWQLYGPNDMVELVRMVTGWDDVSFEELQKVGARRLNMMRSFNAREGIDRKQDVIPEKLFKPLKGGSSDGWKLDRDEVESAMDAYFEICGWDVATGVPTRAKLDELELGWVADQLA
ncbi:MAG TPA: aldehyde ferredoxin oxidoreductase family protein [Anaerolineales bacterium]|nr:aldehyde ferredoxin oxidoreductase family protein [Anaerolineales bacterium]